MACTTPIGDVNVDGKLDSQDTHWLNFYLSTGRYPDKWFNSVCADLNLDGKINTTDLDLLKSKIKSY
ncbi:MAG: dockerin type I repeat-containing protein [Ruminococcus sp.]|nr:dockerin type I repeat-containing protein [Ruminococcus sp.]